MIGVAYHAVIANNLVKQAELANVKPEPTKWVNPDGSDCFKSGTDWICKLPVPKAKVAVQKTPAKVGMKVVTAYNSVPNQTDSTPCIAAYGDNICELEKKGDHSCAGAYPYNTMLKVPGKGVCTVRDVLAPKYADRVDWYEGGSDKIPDAFAWGKRTLQVAVLKAE